MTLLLILLVLVNLVLMVPVVTFSIEVLASILLRRRRGKKFPMRRHPVAVLIPAHQEESGIGETVAALRAQLSHEDRLIVVADNCTDKTASKAREAGAEVVERSDPVRRGKGFALDFGVRHLEMAPANIVIVVDADCTLETAAIDRLASAVEASGRPVQGLNLMSSPPDGGLNFQVAQLAFLVKNLVRSSGLHRMGLSCHLTGTGMAFPWEVIRDANLAHSSLVEDMKLGLDLALAGTPPLYCEEARIDSFFPYTEKGAASQRSRWEEGHLGMIALAVRSLPAAIASGSMSALGLVLDILVPPLTLLLLLVTGAFAFTALATWLVGLSGAAVWIATANLLLLGLAVGLAWYVYGRSVLPPRSLLRVAPYVLGKVKLYRGMLAGKRSDGWVRTERKGPEE